MKQKKATIIRIDDYREIWLNEILTACIACGNRWEDSYKYTEIEKLHECPRCEKVTGLIIDNLLAYEWAELDE